MTRVLLQGPDDRLYAVESGTLNQQAVCAYRWGQCHALAIALSDATG